LRDVLRLRAGDAVTAFDNAGTVGEAIVVTATAENVTIRIDKIVEAAESTFEWTIAAAVPKGQRADWMVEKLAELGTQSLIPLSAARSVSIPGGKEKPARWERLAAEASRQSGRAGVMRIERVVTVAEIVANVRDQKKTEDSGGAVSFPSLGTPGEGKGGGLLSEFSSSAGLAPSLTLPRSTGGGRNPAPKLIDGFGQIAWYLSTEPDSEPVLNLTANQPPRSLLMLIGPEGGWTEQEIALYQSSGIKRVKLAGTVLRVETAAVAAAAIAAAWKDRRFEPS
jgi:16S rRNA (uracil1498-N3)-methyltransferase